MLTLYSVMKKVENINLFYDFVKNVFLEADQNVPTQLTYSLKYAENAKDTDKEAVILTYLFILVP